MKFLWLRLGQSRILVPEFQPVSRCTKISVTFGGESELAVGVDWVGTCNVTRWVFVVRTCDQDMLILYARCCFSEFSEPLGSMTEDQRIRMVVKFRDWQVFVGFERPSSRPSSCAVNVKQA